MMTAMTMTVPHRMPPRELKLRVVLRSSHGITRTTRNSVGTMIVAKSSKFAGTSLSKPKSDKKYHAGYGTNEVFVGSAFASRNGGETNARNTMMRKKMNEIAVSIHI